jgi:hypothetical protein
MNLFAKLYTPKGVAVVLALGIAVGILLFLFVHLVGAALLGERSPTQDTGGGQAPAEQPVPRAGAAQYASPDGSLREVALAQEAQYGEGTLYTPKDAEAPSTKKKAEAGGEGFREETGGPRRGAPTTNASEPLAPSGGPALALPAAARFERPDLRDPAAQLARSGRGGGTMRAYPPTGR